MEIHSGAFHLINELTGDEQNQLLAVYQDYKSELYVPRLKSGHYMNLMMACLGKHWSAVDYRYHDKRIDVDGRDVMALPQVLVDIAARVSTVCFPQHLPEWDICLMNYYKQGTTLGVHQDNSESKVTLDSGHPVISFSIGASSMFRVGGTTRKAAFSDVLLGNGDVFAFGGPSRMRYHGITEILPQEPTAPFYNELDGGRVNFTLRKY